MLISQAEFARRINASRQYVNKLVNKGILPVYDGKRLKYEEAKEILEQLKDPRRDAQREAIKKRKEQNLLTVEPAYKTEADCTPEELEEERQKQKRVLEEKLQEAKKLGLENNVGDVEKLDIKELNRLILEQDLRIKRIKADESEKLLVPIEDTKKTFFMAARVVRDGLNTIPSRLAARLAAESDPHVCMTILESEINTQLAKLSEAINELG